MSAFASKKRKSDAGGPEDPKQTMYVVQDIYRDGSYREDHTNGVFSTLAAANEAARRWFNMHREDFDAGPISKEELAAANAARLESGGKKRRWRVGRGRDDNKSEQGEQREVVWELDGAVSIELRRAEDDEEFKVWVTTFGVDGDMPPEIMVDERGVLRDGEDVFEQLKMLGRD